MSRTKTPRESEIPRIDSTRARATPSVAAKVPPSGCNSGTPSAVVASMQPAEQFSSHTVRLTHPIENKKQAVFEGRDTASNGGQRANNWHAFVMASVMWPRDERGSLPKGQSTAQWRGHLGPRKKSSCPERPAPERTLTAPRNRQMTLSSQLRQICHIPPPAERFDEEHARIHPAAQYVDIVPLVA
jgi:hypothetical protein